MLNKNNERELAYVVTINSITPMNADRLVCAHIAGWHCVVGKEDFKEGDKAVYFEVDSKLPEQPPFSDMEFLVSKHYKIKTQKIRGEISQGLLVPFSAFGWEQNKYEVGEFLTTELNVTYAVEEDNSRKSSTNKYKIMAQRRPDIFKKKWARWFMRREWGRKLMFLIFGRKSDKKNEFPSWVKKTDEERVQNMPWLFSNPTGKQYIGTEKIDGTSTTFTMKRGKTDKKNEYIVCSRNVVQRPEKNTGYYAETDGNVYIEMSNKYNMKDVLTDLLRNNPLYDFITVQGETYGGTIQKRDYGPNHDLAVFNVIFGKNTGETIRLNPYDMHKVMEPYGVPCVPIVVENYILPSTCEDLLEYAEGISLIDGKEREGIVFRDYDGEESFKAVSNSFLLKYHS